MKLFLMLCFFCFCAIAPLTLAQEAASCSSFNSGPIGPASPVNEYGYYGHTTGNHTLQTSGATTCAYTLASGSKTACTASCTATIPVLGGSDTGYITPLLAYHGIGLASAIGQGMSGSSGGTASCSSSSAMTAVQCYFGLKCGTTISISAGYNGVGGSISFPSPSVWNQPYTFNAFCAAAFINSGGGGGGNDPGNPIPIGISPIIIDTDGKGFHFTDAKDGVVFDFFGDGHPIKISWTAPGSTNGWLVLPRNPQRTVLSAKDMFGNITYQPKSPDPNGFLALATFDKESEGGNNDGVIDAGDSVWGSLRVWIDSNHDGVSQPSELFTLDQVGIHSITLTYTEDKHKDQYGNAFRYKGQLDSDDRKGTDIDPTIYDVFLVRE